MNDAPSRPLRLIIGAGGKRPERRAARRAVTSVPLLVLLLAVPPVHGEIFKCSTRNAMPTYQNFPCEFDSLGAVPVTAAPAKGSASPAPKPLQSPTPARPTTTIPRVGMTTKEVKAIWGEPLDTTREEYAKGDIETWKYADSRSIQFDAKGRVTEIRW